MEARSASISIDTFSTVSLERSLGETCFKLFSLGILQAPERLWEKKLVHEAIKSDSIY